MPQTGAFVLRGDRLRAAWRMFLGSGIFGFGAWVLLLTPDRAATDRLLGVLDLLLLVATVATHLPLLIGRPVVVAHAKGIWIRTKTLWRPASERFLPWEKVERIDVIDERRRVTDHYYSLRILPRDVKAELAAQPEYARTLEASVRQYGAPYVVSLGRHDSGDYRDMNIHWDKMQSSLEKVLPSRIRVHQVDLADAHRTAREAGRGWTTDWKGWKG